MSWNAFLVSLGARHSSSVRRIPKEFLRMTAAALQDPVTPTAAVGYIADLQIDMPASEIAANARVLNLNQGFDANHDLATNIRRPMGTANTDAINRNYVFTKDGWYGIETSTEIGNRSAGEGEKGSAAPQEFA
jgi:hypothetical protein